jgi:hypothetical protein
MVPTLDLFQVKMSFTAAQEHVPEADRNNQVIRERVCATYHRLPHRSLTTLMIKC